MPLACFAGTSNTLCGACHKKHVNGRSHEDITQTSFLKSRVNTFPPYFSLKLQVEASVAIITSSFVIGAFD